MYLEAVSYRGLPVIVKYAFDMQKKHTILPEYLNLFINVLSVDTPSSVDISREGYSLSLDCEGNKYFEGKHTVNKWVQFVYNMVQDLLCYGA